MSITTCEKNSTENTPIGYIFLNQNYNFVSFKNNTDKILLNTHMNNSHIKTKDNIIKPSRKNIQNPEELNLIKLPIFENDDSFLNIMEIIIDNTDEIGLNFDLKHTFKSFVANMSNVIRMKDKYTAYHSNHVQHYSLTMSRHLGFTLENQNKIFIAANLHDIGKVVISDALIAKKNKLSDSEFEAVKNHTSRGAEILSHLDNFSDIALIVKQHHERFDGKGYPDGVSGEDIHIMARIVAIADSFDAMTTDRPYRNALSIETALKELIANKGTQFDGRLVDLFAYLVRNNEIKYMKH